MTVRVALLCSLVAISCAPGRSSQTFKAPVRAAADSAEPKVNKDARPSAVSAKPPKAMLKPAPGWHSVSSTGTRLPVTEEQVARVERDSAYSATLDGRLVWLDLRAPSAMLRLKEVSGPIAITLGDGGDASALQALKEISEAHALGLQLIAASDADLAHLKALPQLRSLELRGTAVRDAGLVNLKALPQLRSLNLAITAVTDAALARLTSLTRLQVLNLWSTRVSDVGLAELKALSQLRVLNIGYTQISDAGLSHLKALPELLKIDLGYTHISNGGVAQLVAPPGLLVHAR